MDVQECFALLGGESDTGLAVPPNQAGDDAILRVCFGGRNRQLSDYDVPGIWYCVSGFLCGPHGSNRGWQIFHGMETMFCSGDGSGVAGSLFEYPAAWETGQLFSEKNGCSLFAGLGSERIVRCLDQYIGFLFSWRE